MTGVTIGAYVSKPQTPPPLHTHTLQGRCMHADLCAVHGDGEGPAIPEGQEVGLHPFRPMLHPILCAKAVLHPHGYPARIHSQPFMFISLLALVNRYRFSYCLLCKRQDTQLYPQAIFCQKHSDYAATRYTFRPEVNAHSRQTCAKRQCNTAGSTWQGVLQY